MITALIVLGLTALGVVTVLALFFWLVFIILAFEDSDGHK